MGLSRFLSTNGTKLRNTAEIHSAKIGLEPPEDIGLTKVAPADTGDAGVIARDPANVNLSRLSKWNCLSL